MPHEVIGFANHNKNVYVGAGGRETIDRTHFIGAATGMERIMGRERSPVRDVLDHADERFGGALPPITYLLTVRARDEGGRLVTEACSRARARPASRQGARSAHGST